VNRGVLRDCSSAVCWRPMAYLEPFLSKGERPGEEFSCKIPGRGTGEPVAYDDGSAEQFYLPGALYDREAPVHVESGHWNERGNEIVTNKMDKIIINSNLMSAVRPPDGHRVSMAGMDLN